MVRGIKTVILIGSILIFCRNGYSSENFPKVSSQGGPLGVTSIGDQSLNNTVTSGSTIMRSPNQESSTRNISKKEFLKLQNQVEQLQAQLLKIASQKSTIMTTSGNSSSFTTYGKKVYNNAPNTSQVEGDLTQALVGQATSSDIDIADNVNSKNSIINLENKSLGGVFNQNGAIDVGGAPAITTQGQITFLGSYSGNNSIPIGQISSNLFASTLLGQRDKFDDYSVFFGGYIEADAQTWFGNSTAGKGLSGTGQNIYLTNAKLYFLSNLGHYVTAQFDFDTDESGKFSLGNAFVIFGNLDTSPFFVTAGRNKLSVGAYGGGGPWTDGMTKFLSPDKVTNISLNYKNDVWNANISVFGSNDQSADFSAGLFYTDSWTNNLIGSFNVGYVYNLNGSGNDPIQDFLNNTGSENAKVGAFNIDANLTYGLWGGFLNLGAGWSTTTNSENFNGDGSDVLAGGWYGAANYSLILGGRNTNLGVSYGQTYNATDIPMTLSASAVSGPESATGIKKQLIVSAQRAYFDNNVLFGPEYSYQKLYGGQHMNTITLDMSVYV
ncbi:DUF3573 domain-containing protein [Francisella sp. SYW-9]|uniref:DUF3573 domain-containing protein n=1 Tax=Francisella sp. SYW-9 TaxID=2610888 RepID=UPI00123CD32B|nr:DUF3573 domain-containing protein [Francisella sp. SYW-9]